MSKRLKKGPAIPDLKLLRVKDGDVLAVKDSTVEGQDRFEFVQKMGAVTNAHVLVLFVKKLSDIRHLSEAQMNNAGWYRKDEED